MGVDLADDVLGHMEELGEPLAWLGFRVRVGVGVGLRARVRVGVRLRVRVGVRVKVRDRIGVKVRDRVRVRARVGQRLAWDVSGEGAPNPHPNP